MSTVETPREQKVVVKEMSWDPITRIVGSLGIHTEIDFSNQQVLKCYSTSMIFRGFDIFMKGIDPRDATSSRAGSAASAVTTTAPARA
jgi:hydrogenase large subunit